MIDRRRMLAAATAWAGGAGAAWAGPHRPAPKAFSKRDLEGTWTLATYTDIERPKEVSALVMTEAQARAYEAPRRKYRGMLPSKPGEVGQVESEFTDRGQGLARVNGEIRSSWIVDPPDGKIPYRAAMVARYGLDKIPLPERLDNPEERPGNERCLSNFATGAPMLGAADANLFQVVQTKDCVAIHTEKYHDVRIVRLAGAGTEGAAPPLPPSWLGDSVGRWEGDTLVVETTGLRPGVTSRGARIYVSGETRVVERFTRTGADELFYEFTVEDPSLFTRPWRGEMTVQREKGRIYEYACHEGNYSMPGILAGARLEEKAAAAAPAAVKAGK
jgi:hypothetical protein